MFRASAFCLLPSIACLPARDLPPVCFAQAEITFRSEQAEQCPDPGEIDTALTLVISTADTPISTLNGWTAVYEDEAQWSDERGPFAGLTDVENRLVWVAFRNVYGPIPVTRHEFFHACLFELTGDPDTDHSDSRWNLVN